MSFVLRGGLAGCAALIALLGLSSPASADPFHYEVVSGATIGPSTSQDVYSYLVITDDPSRIVDINVYVELTHDDLGTLDVHLFNADTGIKVKLFDNFPGTGLIAATFDDEAAIPANPALNGNATPPYVGTFKSVHPLWKFNGLPLNGTWFLRVDDEAFGGSGILRKWSISGVTASPEPGSMALLGMGLAGMAGYVRRRRKAKAAKA